MNSRNDDFDPGLWRQLVAEQAIQRVINDYGRGIDELDFERVRRCFHPDARIVYGNEPDRSLDEAVIVGEIEDEHDSSDLVEEQLSEYEFKLSGRLEIDYLNEKYKLDIPESEVEEQVKRIAQSAATYEAKKGKDDIQKLTDDYEKKITELLEAKTKEIQET